MNRDEKLPSLAIGTALGDDRDRVVGKRDLDDYRPVGASSFVGWGSLHWPGMPQFEMLQDLPDNADVVDAEWLSDHITDSNV